MGVRLAQSHLPDPESVLLRRGSWIEAKIKFPQAALRGLHVPVTGEGCGRSEGEPAPTPPACIKLQCWPSLGDRAKLQILTAGRGRGDADSTCPRGGTRAAEWGNFHLRRLCLPPRVPVLTGIKWPFRMSAWGPNMNPRRCMGG